jgi:hypothetical protein
MAESFKNDLFGLQSDIASGGKFPRNAPLPPSLSLLGPGPLDDPIKSQHSPWLAIFKKNLFVALLQGIWMKPPLLNVYVKYLSISTISPYWYNSLSKSSIDLYSTKSKKDRDVVFDVAQVIEGHKNETILNKNAISAPLDSRSKLKINSTRNEFIDEGDKSRVNSNISIIPISSDKSSPLTLNDRKLVFQQKQKVFYAENDIWLNFIV